MKLLRFEYAVRNLGRSPSRAIASVLGSGLVALLMVAASAFVGGMNRGLSVDHENRNVMLLGAGSEESIERSEITAGAAGIAEASIPGVQQLFGVSYVSPECHMAVVVRPSKDSHEEWQASFRGVKDAAFLVHPKVQLVDGRAPRPGQNEIMAGSLAAARLGVSDSRLAVGQTLWFDERLWTITGRFVAPGTVMDAEFWMPLEDLMVATKRTTISTVTMTLAPDGDFADVDAFAKQRLDLELVALPEGAYYAKLMNFYGPIRMMIWITAGLVALGGFFGGLNTMFAAFASRVRELATLQTLGFSRLAIVFSMIQESLLASMSGALIAIVAAFFLLDGAAVKISMGAFGLSIDATAVVVGLLAGLGLGILGTLPPAWRCLTPEIPAALRSA